MFFGTGGAAAPEREEDATGWGGVLVSSSSSSPNEKGLGADEDALGLGFGFADVEGPAKGFEVEVLALGGGLLKEKEILEDMLDVSLCD